MTPASGVSSLCDFGAQRVCHHPLTVFCPSDFSSLLGMAGCGAANQLIRTPTGVKVVISELREKENGFSAISLGFQEVDVRTEQKTRKKLRLFAERLGASMTNENGYWLPNYPFFLQPSMSLLRLTLESDPR